MMDTEEIMALSLKLAGLKTVPEDSAIYLEGRNMRKIFFGIDAGVPELLLARELGYDCVVAHHPAGGTAILNFSQVFRRHIQQMTEVGISKSEAERAVSKKLADLAVDAHARNYDHAVDVAKAIKMPYMNVHTPLDEVGRRIMSDKIRSRAEKDSTVRDVVSALRELPEFRNARTEIEIRVGKPENPAGKVVVSHGAGTNGGYEIAKTYFEHGIGTVIYIHVGVGDLDKLKAESKGNLVVTGHIASDSVGINPFIHELENKGLSVVTAGVVPDR